MHRPTPALPHRPVIRAVALADWLVPVAFVLIIGLWLFTRLESGTAPADRIAHAQSHGASSGVMLSLADDRYHVEALVERGDWLRVLTLDHTATGVLDVERQTLLAYVTAGEISATPVELIAEPQPGDAPGRTSQFVGQLPLELRDQPLQVTIPALRIAGRRYRLGFAWAGQSHLPAMPDKVLDDEERELYLTPGGSYSLADIEANGGLTPSQKFVGFQARHDANPKPGDLLCPITKTKANPQCAWTIGGKRYEFCCPPCIDELVRLAKEDPDQLPAFENGEAKVLLDGDDR